MATFLSTQVTQPGPSAIGLAPGLQVETFSLTIGSTTLANNNILVLAQIPLNSTVLTFYISAPALDVSGPTATWEIGDTTTVGKYVASTGTGPQAAVNTLAHSLNGFVAQSLPAAYTTQTASAPSGITLASTSSVADYLQIKFTAGFNSAATSGTIKGYIVYTLNTAS